jgi:hypothetical protein
MIQAYERDHSTPRGPNTYSSKKDGQYLLSVPPGGVFDVLYDPPDSAYLPMYLTWSAGFKRGVTAELWREGFDGTDGNRYPDTSPVLVTHTQFKERCGEAAFKKHVRTLLKKLPKDHPRVKQQKSLAK